MNHRQPIYTEATECQDCYKCIRECPVKAIKIEHGRAAVVEEGCIHCGHCVAVCPVGAKRVRQDVVRAQQLIRLKKTYVSLAPSFRTEFSELSDQQLIAMLLALGFTGVSETALGADRVSAYTAKILPTLAGGVYVSSACPSVVELIKKYYPQVEQNVMSVMSPLMAHAQLLRETYGQEIGVVFIGPCIAKKKEVDRCPELIDVALTFDELRQWFVDKQPSANIVETAQFVPFSAAQGCLYPIDGGMIASIKQQCSTTDQQFMSFSGIATIKETLPGLESWADNKQSVFVEMLSCEGGCIHGPAAKAPGSIITKRLNIIKSAPAPRELACPAELDMTWNIPACARPQYTLSQLSEMLRRIGKVTPEDELNCSGCGYDTCRQFAEALLTGHAEQNMCVTYMRKLAHNKANALLQTMPAGAVIVNEHLEVMECNRVFAELLGDDIADIFKVRPGLPGARLKALVPFIEIFKQVLSSGEEQTTRDIRYKDMILQVTVFTIEKQRVVGAICTDITTPAVQRERIVRQTSSALKKNITAVQKIAYILGENAAEIETILNSIVQSLGPKTKEPTRYDH